MSTKNIDAVSTCKVGRQAVANRKCLSARVVLDVAKGRIACVR